MLPGFSVRPARAADAAACRSLLPDAFPAVGRAPELFVADGPAGLTGAAAVAWVPGGFPVLLHVAAPFRRQGLGRALLAAAAESAAGETRALRSWTTVAADSGAAAFLAGAGFRAMRRFLVFETDATVFGQAMTRLLRRVAGRIPASARLVPLRDAAPGGVVRLVAPAFAALPHDVAVRLLPGARNGYDGDHSLVLLHEGEVAGAMLCHAADGALEVDVNAIAAPLRGGWANLMLLEAMARGGREAGFARFRFGCEPHVHDTLNLARRTGAAALPDQLAMERPLPA